MRTSLNANEALVGAITPSGCGDDPEAARADMPVFSRAITVFG